MLLSGPLFVLLQHLDNKRQSDDFPSISNILILLLFLLHAKSCKRSLIAVFLANLRQHQNSKETKETKQMSPKKTDIENAAASPGLCGNRLIAFIGLEGRSGEQTGNEICAKETSRQRRI
jgi:hypothetical protein